MSDLSATPTRLKLLSPAKINLFLHVVDKRADGHHNLQTLFQFLELHDIVEIELAENDGIERVDCHDFALPDFDLAVRAAQLISQYRKAGNLPGVRITLNKAIPIGSGMGGGSSNAAAVLVGLDRLWGLRLGESVLLELGTQLGADIPIFIKGHACWAEGIGNELAACTPPEKWHVLWIPDCNVSTKTIFEHPELIRDNPLVSYKDCLEGRCGNTLEPVARKLFEPVDEALSILGQHGKAQLNGSGASVFLPCTSFENARSIQKQLPQDKNIHILRSMNRFGRFLL